MKKPKSPHTQEESPLAVVEEAGVAFDPTTQSLDLTKDEKRRTTALMMAIQAYEKLIIKDAEMYIAVSRDVERSPNSPKITPATINAMVEAAIQFDLFISGAYSRLLPDEPAKSAAKPEK